MIYILNIIDKIRVKMKAEGKCELTSNEVALSSSTQIVKIYISLEAELDKVKGKLIMKDQEGNIVYNLVANTYYLVEDTILDLSNQFKTLHRLTKYFFESDFYMTINDEKDPDVTVIITKN